MNNYKIKVNDQKMAMEVQELFEQIGYEKKSISSHFPSWISNFHECNGRDCKYTSEPASHWLSNCQELTLPQLRDLVVLHRNDIQDANWVTEGSDQIYKDSSGKSFIFRERGWDELQRHEMRQAMWEKIKPKPQPTEHEQGLISGADVPRLIKDGQQVQLRAAIGFKLGEWKDLVLDEFEEELTLGDFINSRFEWRLKPRTIKLELEIPAPFEPRERERYWFIDSCSECGYSSAIYHDVLEDAQLMQYGAYQSEQDVISARDVLRGIKG